jgi:hypothetical protein
MISFADGAKSGGPSLLLAAPGSDCETAGVTVDYACITLTPPAQGGVRSIEGQLELLMVPTRETDR